MRYHPTQHFQAETGVGAVADRCRNCRNSFMDHYNGRCPIDESEDTLETAILRNRLNNLLAVAIDIARPLMPGEIAVRYLDDGEVWIVPAERMVAP